MSHQGPHAQGGEGTDHAVDLVPVDLEGGRAVLGGQVVDPLQLGQGVRPPVQLGDEGGAGHVAQLRERSRLDDPTLADDGEPIGQRLHLREDVAGEQHRAPGGLDLGDRLLEDHLHQRVQSGGRLVQQQQVHLGGERRDQCHLLSIALGVGAGLLGGVEVEALAQLVALAPVQSAAQARQQVDRLTAGESGPQLHIAGNIGQPTVQGHRVAPRVPAQQAHGAAVGAQHPQQHAHGGGLPGPVRSQEAMHLAGGDLEVEAVQGAGAAEGLDQSLRGDHGCGAHERVSAPRRGWVGRSPDRPGGRRADPRRSAR